MTGARFGRQCANDFPEPSPHHTMDKSLLSRISVRERSPGTSVPAVGMRCVHSPLPPIIAARPRWRAQARFRVLREIGRLIMRACCWMVAGRRNAWTGSWHVKLLANSVMVGCRSRGGTAISRGRGRFCCPGLLTDSHGAPFRIAVCLSSPWLEGAVHRISWRHAPAGQGWPLADRPRLFAMLFQAACRSVGPCCSFAS